MQKRKRPSATIKKAKEKKANKQTSLKDLLKQFPLAKIGYFFLGMMLVGGITFSGIWINKKYQSTDDLMPLRIVEIEGKLKNVTREEIIEQLLKSKVTKLGSESIKLKVSGTNAEKVSGTNESKVIGFFSSDLQLIEMRLQSIAWLQSAKLRRVWPDKIHIKIKEQKAIARWNDEALINEYGELFTPRSIEEQGHLPLLTGPEKELSKLLATFQELQKRLEAIDLQLMVLNLNHRYSWSLKLASGIELEVGREQLMERVQRFITLYPLLERESKLPIVKVDLRYDTGLAVTRSEDSELTASL